MQRHHRFAKPAFTPHKDKKDGEIIYDTWEGLIANSISFKLCCPLSDAHAMMEANPFIIAQSWTKGLSAQDTASKILNQ